jgi:hypothetical protein
MSERDEIVYLAEQALLPFHERDCPPCKGAGCSRCGDTGRLTKAHLRFGRIATPMYPRSFSNWLFEICNNCDGTKLINDCITRNGKGVVEKKDCACVLGLCVCPTCWDSRHGIVESLPRNAEPGNWGTVHGRDR